MLNPGAARLFRDFSLRYILFGVSFFAFFMFQKVFVMFQKVFVT